MRSGPVIGLVVVGYESDEVWPQFFDRLTKSSILPTKVVVVENSKKYPASIPNLSTLEVDVIHLPHNPGYGSAINRGVQSLPADVTDFVVCNADTLLVEDTIGQLVDHMNDFPHTGVLGPRIEDSGKNLYPSARAIPTVAIGIGHALFSGIWPSNPWTKKYFGDYSHQIARPAGWLSGSFLLVNRMAFDAVGGFDEQYFMFFEDVDFCYRLRRNGWASTYVPQAMVTHLGGHSTSTRMPEMARAHHQAAQRFLAKLYPGRRFALLRGVINAGLAIRSAMVRRSLSRKNKNQKSRLLARADSV